MKKNILKFCICICFILCLIPDVSIAQNKKPLNLPLYDNEPYHFGISVGYNQMLFSIDYIDGYQSKIHQANELPANDIFHGVNDDFLNSEFIVNDISGQMTHGITIGVVGNLRLSKYFDLRFIPSGSFGERKLTYNITSIQKDPVSGEITKETPYTINSSTHSTFVEFPLHIKYKSKRYNNTAAYIIAGANYKIDWASQKKNYDETSGKPKTLSIKRHDIAAEIGAGFDFYTGYCKLGVELKMGYGLLNVAKNENYLFTNSFDSLRNKTFLISFTFE